MEILEKVRPLGRRMLSCRVFANQVVQEIWERQFAS